MSPMTFVKKWTCPLWTPRRGSHYALAPKLTLILLLSVVGLLTTVYWNRSISRAAAKQELLESFVQLDLGSSEQVIRGILEDKVYLTMRSTMDDELIDTSFTQLRIYTPLTFGAKNWVLIVLLDDGINVAYGVRTNDSDFEKPKDAPPDKFNELYKEAWHLRFVRSKTLGEPVQRIP